MASSPIKRVVLGTDDNGLDISMKISKLVFKEEIKKTSTLELTCYGEDAEELVDLSELSEGKAILFSFGSIRGTMSRTRVAGIVDIEITYSGNAPTMLLIRCVDKGFTAQRVTSNKIWKNVTTADIVQSIAKTHGYKVSIQELSGGFTKWDSLPQASMSDMEFLQYLAIRETGGNYVCYVQDNVLYFITHGTGNASSDLFTVGADERLIKLAIKYRESSSDPKAAEVTTTTANGRAQVNPATASTNTALGERAFVMQSGAAFIQNNSGTFEQAIANAKRFPNAMLNKTDVNNAAQTASNAQQLLTTGVSSFMGHVPNPEEATLYTQGARMAMPKNTSDIEASNYANGLHKRSKKKLLVATLEEIGNPGRTINTVLTFKNIAKKYVGNWYTESVVHTLDKDYVTVSELRKDAGKKGSVPVAKSNTSVGEKADSVPRVFLSADGDVYKADEGKSKPTVGTAKTLLTQRRLR